MEGERPQKRQKASDQSFLFDSSVAPDLLLFAHLIPLCQYHAYNDSKKESFEIRMEIVKSSFGDQKNFLDYLFAHPANKAVIRGKKDLQGNFRYFLKFFYLAEN